MACKSCIGKAIKSAIINEFPQLENLVGEIPDCKSDAMITVCPTGGKTKRAPSAYNTFIGTCMKQGKGMKECAAEYRGRQT